MALSPRQKKWFKKILVTLVVILAIRGLLYYVVVVRFKDLVQIAVTKESGGTYQFDARKIKFNFWAKNIVVERALITCTDTLRSAKHHEVAIPQMYLSIDSWTEMVLHKRLIVDSFSMSLPGLYTHAHDVVKKEEQQISLNAAGIFSMLQKVAANLEIRSFDIRDGAYTYASADKAKPFLSNRINLIIKNFSSKNQDQANKLFSSDDIDIALYNQHWFLPDGLHEISFKKLHFSGKKQLFEVDSFTFNKPAAAGKKAIHLTADKFFFNSKQLTSIYEKEELLIDTLICIRPILHISGQKNEKTAAAKKAIVSETMQGFFKNINFKYIDIQGGQLLLGAHTKDDTSDINKTNLKIHNLAINPDSEPHITTDSINFVLSKLLFISADSLTQIGIREFTLHDKDANFKDATFGPTPRNQSRKILRFTTPLLSLKNIDLEALIGKKLKAAAAELYYPDIIVNNDGKSTWKVTDSINGSKTEILIQSVNGIRGLIDVTDFKIHHGNLKYSLAGETALQMKMKDMNAHILLTQLLQSDSMINIKQSMPLLEVKEITLAKGGLSLHLSGFNFNGQKRQSQVSKVNLRTNSGTTIDATGIYWDKLNWNQFVNNNMIQIGQLQLKNLAVNLGEKSKPGAGKTQLPRLNVQSFVLDRIQFSSKRQNSQLNFSGSHIALENITTANNIFFWKNPVANLQNIAFSSKTLTATVNKLQFVKETTAIENVRVSVEDVNQRTLVTTPSLLVKMRLNSTDFSMLHVNDLQVNEPVIDMISYGKKATLNEPKAVKIPMNFLVERLMVDHAAINNNIISGNDTTHISASTSIKLTNVKTQHTNNKLLNIDGAAIELTAVTFKKDRLTVTVPSVELSARNTIIGATALNKISFATAVDARWLNASVQRQAMADSVLFEAVNLSGTFEDSAFTIHPEMKWKLPALLQRTQLKGGNIYFKNNAFTAKVGAIQWNPVTAGIYLKQYSLLPNLSEGETFEKAKWQADYMTVSGAAGAISGIQLNEQQIEDSIHISRITVDSVLLQTTRDKRIPFQHDIEKLMPSLLMGTVKKTFHVDSVLVYNSSVIVNEISKKTNKKAVIPITNLNAVITNLNNSRANDSLTIVASGDVLNNHINNFYYKEAKGDSLAYFEAALNISPLQLTSFNEVIVPMANVSIARGRVDTLFATWTGNKHGAIGEMNFYYNSLRIQLLDKKDPTKKRFFLNVVSRLASMIIRSNNNRPTQIFFIRDKEKFVFNYWMKTLSSGALTSAGVKRNKKYLKQYKKVKDKYALPAIKQ